MSETMKIHKLYPNTLELKLGSHEAACYDIHAHLRGPVTPEDVAPLIREIKWYDGYNQPHTTTCLMSCLTVTYTPCAHSL